MTINFIHPDDWQPGDPITRIGEQDFAFLRTGSALDHCIEIAYKK